MGSTFYYQSGPPFDPGGDTSQICGEEKGVESFLQARWRDRTPDEMQVFKHGIDTLGGKIAPRARRGRFRCAIVAGAEQKACFLEGFADGGERKGAGAGRGGALKACGNLALGHGIERAGHRHGAIARFKPPSRKHIGSRHEGMAVVAAAHEKADLGPAAV